MEHSPTSATSFRVGAYTVARDSRCGTRCTKGGDRQAAAEKKCEKPEGGQPQLRGARNGESEVIGRPYVRGHDDPGVGRARARRGEAESGNEETSPAADESNPWEIRKR